MLKNWFRRLFRRPEDRVTDSHMPEENVTGIPTETSSESDETELGSLLKEDIFLEKFLGYLIDGGLEECRLVCKNWYEVSKKLPVKLIPTVTNMSSCSRLKQFPNVSSVVLNPQLKQADVQVRRERRKSLKRFEFNLDVLYFLDSFKCLKHLDVSGVVVHHNCFPIMEASQYLQHLHSLNLGDKISPDRLSDLNHLTDLTALTVICNRKKLHTDLAPLTSLSKIQRLKASTSLLLGSDGSLLFPSLTKLTHLSTCADVHSDRLMALSTILNEIGCYISSLRSLDLFEYGKICSTQDACSLAQFTSLESLSFEEFSKTSENLPLLGPLMHLKELNVFGLHLTKAVSQWLGSLPSLTSLCYSQLVRVDVDRGVSEESAADDCCNYLEQLSRLSFKGRSTGNSFATHVLVDLRVEIGHAHSWIRNLNSMKVLGHQTNLTRLEFDCQRLYIPSAALANLTRLKSLLLHGVDVDEDVFWTLRSLQELTSLHFSVQNVGIPGREFRLMTGLISLTLGCFPHSFDVAFVELIREGSFPRLKYLHLVGWRRNQEEEEKLRRDRPCLRILYT